MTFRSVRRLIHMSYKKYKGYTYQTIDYTVNDMDISPNTVFSILSAVVAFSMLTTCIIMSCMGGAPAGLKIATAIMMSFFLMMITGRLIMMTRFINRHAVTGYRIIKSVDGRFIIQGRDGLGSWRSIDSSSYSFKWDNDAYGYSDYDDAVKNIKKLSSSYPIQPRLLKAFMNKGIDGLLRRTKIGKGTTVIEFTNENDLK